MADALSSIAIGRRAESPRAWSAQSGLAAPATREGQLASCYSGRERRRSSAYRARVLENSFKGEFSYGKRASAKDLHQLCHHGNPTDFSYLDSRSHRQPSISIDLYRDLMDCIRLRSHYQSRH